ncbi:DUF429 domain-containing protein [Streptomyces sp. NPDC059467]|uniref:DUF429 domain-containing protein n=1 Tax=Streptomyces sp. NPDC059467 TaxID=3346844 RepID=UPI003683FCA1
MGAVPDVDVLGVDACGKQGWVGIGLADGAYAGSFVDTRLDALVERAATTRVIAVDMPLGLLETGWRAADGFPRHRNATRRAARSRSGSDRSRTRERPSGRAG